MEKQRQEDSPGERCSRGHCIMKLSMMRRKHLLGLHREIFSKVHLAHSCPVEWEVGSAVHKGTGQTQRMLWRQATFCVPTGSPPQHSHTTKRNTLINLASKVLKTNHDSCWRLPWGDSKREDYTAKQREKLEGFCPSFSIQKLHYLQMLPPALFSVFESSDDLSLPLNFCVILFLCDLFLGIHWPSHGVYHLFIPSIQQKYMELNIKCRIFFRRFDKGKSVSDYIFCYLYKIVTKKF